MTIEEFLKEDLFGMTEYCPLTIDKDGQIYNSEKGHLQTLVDICGNENVMEELPKDKSLLFCLLALTGSVLVDYENQVYAVKLTKQQERVLDILQENNYIKEHRFNIEKLI